jgi:hypothetical protein
MKIAVLIARLLLALVFLVFGLNGFLHFMNGPLPPGLTGQFLNALVQSHYDFVHQRNARRVVGGWAYTQPYWRTDWGLFAMTRGGQT